jgi:hypothetical protein
MRDTPSPDGSVKWELAWIIVVGVLVLLGLGYGLATILQR